MNDIQQLRRQARSLREQKKYSDALNIFKQIWEKNNLNRDKWDGWGYALCLNKCGMHEEALKVCKAVFKFDNQFEYICSQYAWSAYMTKIKDYSFDDRPEKINSYGKGILKLTSNKKTDIFRQLTVLKLMEYHEKRTDWKAVIWWSQQIDCSILSTDSFTTELPNGKKVKLPSKKESWFLKATKALEKLGEFEKCRELTNDALKEFPESIWLKRRYAISEGKIGNIDNAIESLIKISQQKNEWFIFRDIADLYFDNKNYEKALDYIIEACLSSSNLPKPENRWELYFLLGHVLYQLNIKDLAKKHVLFAYHIRNQSGWKIPLNLQNLVDALDIDINENININHQFNQLKNYWANHKYSKLPKLQGKIKTILPGNKAGFISANDGKDYYFKTKAVKGKLKNLDVGIDVEFYVSKSFDRSKNKDSEQAININILN